MTPTISTITKTSQPFINNYSKLKIFHSQISGTTTMDRETGGRFDRVDEIIKSVAKTGPNYINKHTNFNIPNKKKINNITLTLPDANCIFTLLFYPFWWWWCLLQKSGSIGLTMIIAITSHIGVCGLVCAHNWHIFWVVFALFWLDFWLTYNFTWLGLDRRFLSVRNPLCRFTVGYRWSDAL